MWPKNVINQIIRRLYYLTFILVHLINPKKIVRIHGQFENGELQGKVEITYADGSIFEGLTKDNVFHGIAR